MTEQQQQQPQSFINHSSFIHQVEYLNSDILPELSWSQKTRKQQQSQEVVKKHTSGDHIFSSEWGRELGWPLSQKILTFDCETFASAKVRK